MRRDLTMLAGLLALAAGCAPAFVYRPNGPAPGARPVQARVAVLPFENGTEDFVERIGPGTEKKWNLARKGLIGMMGALPPLFWSKSLADDLASSGRFRSARLVYSQQEIGDDEVFVEGTLLKAYIFGSPSPPGEWVLSLRAVRTKDRQVVWERKVERYFAPVSSLPPNLLEAWLTQSMREMFAEVGVELAAAIRAASDRGAAGTDDAGASSPPDEPVEKAIERILEGR